MDSYNYNDPTYGSQALDNRVSAVMRRVYVKMTLGLLITALVSLWAASSSAYVGFMMAHSWFMWVLVIAELGIVFGLSGAIQKMSNAAASGLFYLFAVVNGLMLFAIFLAYDPTSIYKTFFITAGTFGAMSVFGYCTKQDLTKFGAFLFYALIGLIIATVVNIFLKSSGFDWIISIAGVLIFVGLTAWDTQTIKRWAMQAPAEQTSRLATLGALSLYLDFINLFLYLLRFFGRSNN